MGLNPEQSVDIFNDIVDREMRQCRSAAELKIKLTAWMLTAGEGLYEASPGLLELSGITKVPVSTIRREIRRWDQGGIVQASIEGKRVQFSIYAHAMCSGSVAAPKTQAKPSIEQRNLAEAELRRIKFGIA